MLTPGAIMRTHGPKFDQPAHTSFASIAPATIALGALDGDAVHASAALFPAAIAYVTPEAMDASTAAFSDDDRPPMKLMFTTAGRAPLLVIQSTASTALDSAPLPEQSSTRIAFSVTALATPYVALPTVPATCVP